jgi:toxin-antitoxin system PIN domain toxin
VIALDTNILVYARRAETPFHQEARKLLRDLAEGRRPWSIPWVCVYEFVRVVTHPRVFDPPTALDAVVEDLESLLDSPTLMLLGEGPRHAGAMREALFSGQATGNLVHDAHIAAILLEHGVRELWTADRDFARFAGLKVRDPFHPRLS